MSWFVIGLVLGALLSIPVIPLLRATDPVFGFAIVGIFFWRRDMSPPPSVAERG